MIIDNDFIPKSIIMDLANTKTKIIINPNWGIIENNDQSIVVFHEKNGVIRFKNNDLEFELLKKLLFLKAVSIKDFIKCDLVGLWKKELYRIYNENNDLIISEKYRYFLQFL